MYNPRWLLLTLAAAALVLIYGLSWLLVKFWPKFYRVAKSLFISIGRGLRQNEYIDRLIIKNQGLWTFLGRRFRHDSFWGLPATLFGLAFLYVLTVFLGLVEDFVTADTIVAADTRFNQLMVLFRSEYFVRIFLFITNLGRWQIVASLALVVVLTWWWFKKSRYILGLLTALVGSTFFDWLTKLVFHRPRPPFPVYLEPSYSFPSGHATVAVAFYGFLIYYLTRSARKVRTRAIILTGGFFLILAIGFSRLYLSVHYLSDVWGGYLLGGLWLILGIGLTEWHLAKRGRTEKDAVSPDPVLISRLKITTGALLLAEAVFFVYLALNYNPTPPRLATQSPQIIAGIFNLSADFNKPRATETITAARQEPLSFIVAALNDQVLIDDFGKAGWVLADPINDDSLEKMAEAALLNSPYPTAPMTPSFWDGEVNAFGFEKATESDTIRQRNHARFWKTNLQTKDGLNIYVGTASLDSGLKWGITHKIDPAIDVERERLFADLESAQIVKDYQKVAFVPPTLGQNFTGDAFFTDGQTYIIVLK